MNQEKDRINKLRDFEKYAENYLRGSIFSARNGKSYDTERFEREVLEKSQKRS